MAIEQGSRFEKFSERARRALSRAQDEAQRLDHGATGTGHILLGLIQETEGIGVRVLSSLAVDLGKVRSDVEFIIGRGEKPPAEGEIRLTPRAKKVVELAVDEAKHMDHTYIGTEYLLIGLLREAEGVAARVLNKLGVTLDNVRIATAFILGGQQQESEQDTALEAEPNLVSLAQQLVALQQYVEEIEAEIAAIEAMKQSLPALEGQRQAKLQEIMEVIGKLRALL